MLKKLTAIVMMAVLAVVIVFLPSPAAAAEVTVAVNWRPLSLSGPQPYVAGGIVMLPLRAASEALGAHVSWDGANNNATLLRGNNVAIIKKGGSRVYVNGTPYPLSTASTLSYGTIYVPQDFIAAVFGFPTYYNGSVLNLQMDELPVYYTKGFRVKYLDGGSKLVTDGENSRLLLFPRGGAAPVGVVADKTIPIPLRNVMTSSAGFVGVMAQLGVLDSLSAVTISEPYWYVPGVRQAMQQGAVKYVGGDNMEAPDYELVKAISPELAFVYTDNYAHVMQKFDEMGIRYAVNNENAEADFLARMEWIKFVGAFYNKELQAEKIFNDALYNINRTTAKVQGLNKPKVAWGLSWYGKVYVADVNSYVGKWISMCQGNYVFQNIKAGQDTQVSMEDFYAMAKDADILIYSSTTNYMNDASIQGIIKENPLFADIKAVQNGQVWAYAPDWWQTLHETDVFVEDIAAVFHPEAFGGHQYRKLVKLP
jgi:iron complex transport system substrate-binding protein